MRISYVLACTLLAAGLLASLPATAQVPTTITHQGRLLDDSGAPVSGSADLTFSLYDAATGGATLWSEQVTVDLGSDGFYSVDLGGTANPVNQAVLDATEVHLELSVNGNALSPRLKVNSVPYAVTAGQANSVMPGSITTQSIADGAVTSTQLASVPWQKLTNVPVGLDDGDADTLGALMCNSGDVASWNGSAWACSGLGATYTDADAIAAVGPHYNDAMARAAVGAHYTDADVLAATDIEVVDYNDSRLTYRPAVASDCASGTGLWCTTGSNAWGLNRFGTLGRYTQCSDNADCSGNDITLNLTNNTARTVLMSHLDWSNTREFDVYLSYDGGANYYHHRSFNTYRPETNPPSAAYTSTIRVLASNLPMGVNIRLRVVATRGRLHFEGFGLSDMLYPDTPTRTSQRTYVAGFSQDWRNNAASAGNRVWTDIPQRTLTFHKSNSRSAVKISYTDTLGTYGTGYNQCIWRILVDGVSRQQFSTADSEVGLSWRMAHATHSVVVGGLAQGEHTVVIQNYRNNATECLQGWASTGGQIVSEELD